MELPKLYTTEETAKLLRRSRQGVRDLIAAGRLDAHRIGHAYVVPEAAIAKMLEESHAEPQRREIRVTYGRRRAAVKPPKL